MIYKYELNFDKNVALELHSQFKITGAALQGKKPYIWVKTEEILGPRRIYEFYMVGTGVEFPRNDYPLYTISQGNDEWHVMQARKALNAAVVDPEGPAGPVGDPGTEGPIDDGVSGARIPAPAIDPLEALKNKK